MTATDTITTADQSAAAAWPLQTLLDASGLTRSRLAAELHLSGATLRIAGRRGLTDRQADEWAIHLGLHPLLVWGWAWIDQAASARRSASALLAERLRDQLARGALRPGDQLPGVHTLARQWGVGSKTVVRALDELRAEGLLLATAAGRLTVASTLPAGSADCAVCGRVIAEGEEHYPHRAHCAMAARGWCECDQAAHPECCPTCATGATA